ncbi:MAG: MATE family efflux transporter [Ruminococcaceae bacterium]|nr:MATE family efflux transporter [Oscillospiraceae bacterium]
MFRTIKRKFIGDKAFYKAVLALVIPLIIQQGITSFVSLLDNIMVGALGTASISAVAIVNQLMMVFNLTIFGAISGVAIFGAQFFGKGDMENFRFTFRFKMILSIIASVLGILVFVFFGGNLINMFLHESEGSAEEIKATYDFAMNYMYIMLVGLIPFAIVQAYGSTLRETGETVAPMVASVIAILTNLVLNYLFMFGIFHWGVVGAALATVISRYIEMVYVVLHAHRHKYKYNFIIGAYKSLYVPMHLIKKIAITGFPLLLNETLWSMGMTAINQSYSLRGLEAVAAVNMNATAWQIFCIIMMAMGSAVAIIVGQHLGAGEIEKAKDVDNKLIFLTVVLHIGIGIIFIAASPFIPLLYNVEPTVRSLATSLMIINGASLPIHAFVHVVYFTIRSGGKTMITFFFDCVYTWCVPVVLASVLCNFTTLSLPYVYFAVQFIDIVKTVIGIFMLKSGFWAKNIIDDDNKKEVKTNG